MLAPNPAPLASICIPNFNMMRYLPASIESALAQDYPNLEIIIQENRSSDDSLTILRRYAKEDKRIRVFENERHVSMSANWNQCVRHSSGEYFVLLSADDLLEPRFISAAVEALTQHPRAGYCCTERLDIDDAGTVVQRYQYYTDSAVIPALAELRIELIANFAVPSQTVIRRRSFDEAEGYDERFDWAHDIHLRLKLLFHGDALYLTDPLCRYRVHSAMSSSHMVVSKLGIMEIHRLRLDILDRLPAHARHLRDLLPGVLRNHAKICIAHGVTALRSNDRRLAQEYAHLALGLDLTAADMPQFRNLRSWLDGAPMPERPDPNVRPVPFPLPEGAVRLASALGKVA